METLENNKMTDSTSVICSPLFKQPLPSRRHTFLNNWKRISVFHLSRCAADTERRLSIFPSSNDKNQNIPGVRNNVLYQTGCLPS